MSKKKEKSIVDTDVFDVGKTLLLVISTMIPIATASAALTAMYITTIGYIFVGAMVLSLFLALAFCVEGLFRRDKRLVELSRYFVYLSLILLVVFYISISINISQIAGTQINPPAILTNQT